jgi:hypothetical protein
MIHAPIFPQLGALQILNVLSMLVLARLFRPGKNKQVDETDVPPERGGLLAHGYLP